MQSNAASKDGASGMTMTHFMGGTLRELVGGSKPIPSRSPRIPFNLNQQRKDQEHEQRTDGGADS
jgi:hypothetical protein